MNAFDRQRLEHMKQRMAAAEMRHELDMRRKGYVATSRGKSRWVKSGTPFRQRRRDPIEEALQQFALIGAGLLVAVLLWA